MNFSKIIIRWYHQNKRDLPWRHTADPYKIWLSEIILQQTRVQQGLPYYEKFTRKFPTVHRLAKAKEDEVMKAWQGLGYYSRARNLHHTAKYISNELKGKFPNDYETIKSLKGIGEYTAAAIASFAFHKPHAVVDGNVFRVLSRYFGTATAIDSTEGKKEFTRKANLLLDKKDPGTFNQAMMEFGAMQCVPQNPDCRKCPLKKGCVALKKKRVNDLPVKSKKTKVRTRYFNYFLIRSKGRTLIQKRHEKDIWNGLYEFPLVETNSPLQERKLKVSAKAASKNFKHLLSHQIIFARFWEVKTLSAQLKKIIRIDKKISFYVNDNQLFKYAFPKLILNYFDETGFKKI